MVYLLITCVVFITDLLIKYFVDRKYARKVRHPRLGGRIILEKYYNDGAALNLLEKRPKLMRLLHSAALVIVGVFSYFLMRTSGRPLEKTGVDFCVFIGALLAVAGAETAQRHMQ